MIAQKGVRLHYLDSLRGVLMTMGIFLHGGIVASALWAPAVVSYFSGMFRMKLFFFIGGFFIAQVASRKGTISVLRDRIVRLGVPLLAFVVLVNPVANYLLFSASVGPVDFWTFVSPRYQFPATAPDYMNWHLQLWFLLTLLVYSLLTPVVMPLARFLSNTSFLEWLLKRDSTYALLLLGVILTVLFVAARSAHFVLFQRYLQGGPLNFPVQATLWYFPYFVLGAVAFMNRRLFDLMHTVRWTHILLATLGLIFTAQVYEWLKASHGLAAAEFVEHLCKGFGGFMFCSLALTLAKRWFSTPSHFGRICSEASYTVFLVHYVAIAAVFYVLTSAGLMGLPSVLLYVGTVIVVYAVCMFVHFYGVNKFRALGLLINGRSPFPARPVAVPQALQPLHPAPRRPQASNIR